MKHLSFSYQLGLFYGAYGRLKEWFDPAQEGSPYEATLLTAQPHDVKRPLLLKKRAFIRY